MAATWPAGLPAESTFDGWSLSAMGQPLLQSQMQSGRVRQRPQFTLRIAPLRWSAHFTAAQFATFSAFVLQTLGDGAGDFTMPVWVPSANAYQPRMVQIANGAAGISAQPYGDPAAPDYVVTMTLNVRNL